MTKSITGYLAGAVFAVTFAAQAQAADKVDVALGSFGFLYVETMAADTMGYFADEGIDATVRNLNSGTKAVAAVVSGSSQFTVTAPQASFIARNEGADLVVVGSAITQLASNVVVSKEWAAKNHIADNSSYEDRLKALRGSKIGITTPGSGTEQLIRFLAEQGKLDPARDLSIVPLGSTTAMLPALSQGQVDGFTSSPPVPDKAAHDFGAVTLFNLIGGQVKPLDGFLYQGVVVTGDTLKQNPDLVVRFLKAIQKALDAIHDPASSEKVRDAVKAKYYPKLGKDLYDGVWKDFEPAFPKTVSLNQGQVKQIADFVAKFGKPISQQAQDTGWTNKYAEEALKSR